MQEGGHQPGARPLDWSGWLDVERAWAYALAIEAYRSPVMPYDLDDLLHEKGGYNEHDLLGIATAEAVEELANLDELAEAHLCPHLGEPPAPDPSIDPEHRRVRAWSTPDPDTCPHRFAPTFEASELCAADADLVYNDTLYEFKTRLGAKNSRGNRADALPTIDLYQLIAYALFDTHDTYSINNVAIYSARYGRHTMWPLHDLLTTLAGRQVNLAEERAHVWTLLGGA